MGAVGVVVVIVGLVLSVALHELGHMIPAKRFGALVPEYAIGFGSRLFSRVWGETRYSLRLVPLGGFVRILGMFRPAPEGIRTLTRAGKPTLAEEARRASFEELPEGSEHRAFYLLSPGQKIVVMFGGPLMNLLLSVLLAAVAMMGIGFPVATPTLSAVPERLQVGGNSVSAPAYEVGIREGDTLRAIAGREIREWAEVPSAIASSAGAPVSIEVERAGQRHTYEVQPLESAPGAFSIGVVAGREYRSASFSQVVSTTWASAVGTAKLVVSLPVSLWKVGESLLTGAPRDPAGVMSVVGVGRVAAEVTADSAPGEWRQTAALLLSILSSLNMALCVFNLLPFPPLDGGHIASAFYEAVRRRIAAWRGQPDPGLADTARLMPMTYTMGALFIGMTVLLVVADIVRPLTLR